MKKYPLKKFSKFHSKSKFSGHYLNEKVFLKKESYLIKTLTHGLIKKSELTTLTLLLKKILKKKGIFFFRRYPYLPLTAKPSEVRMGRGKGGRFRDNVCVVKPGYILLELSLVSESVAQNLIKLLNTRLAVKVYLSRMSFF